MRKTQQTVLSFIKPRYLSDMPWKASSSKCKDLLLHLIFTQQSIVGGKQFFHWHVLAVLGPLPWYDKCIWQQTFFTDECSLLWFNEAVYMLCTNTAALGWWFCLSYHVHPPQGQMLHMFMRTGCFSIIYQKFFTSTVAV